MTGDGPPDAPPAAPAVTGVALGADGSGSDTFLSPHQGAAAASSPTASQSAGQTRARPDPLAELSIIMRQMRDEMRSFRGDTSRDLQRIREDLLELDLRVSTLEQRRSLASTPTSQRAAPAGAPAPSLDAQRATMVQAIAARRRAAAEAGGALGADAPAPSPVSLARAAAQRPRRENGESITTSQLLAGSDASPRAAARGLLRVATRPQGGFGPGFPQGGSSSSSGRPYGPPHTSEPHPREQQPHQRQQQQHEPWRPFGSASGGPPLAEPGLSGGCAAPPGMSQARTHWMTAAAAFGHDRPPPREWRPDPNFPWTEGEIAHPPGFDPAVQPASHNQGLKAHQPHLRLNMYGYELRKLLTALQTYVSTQVQNRPSTVGGALQHALTCFEGDDQTHVSGHMPLITGDLMYALPPRQRFAGVYLHPGQADQVGAVIAYSVRSHLYDKQPERDVAVLRAMRQGKDSLTCSKVDRNEPPSEALERFMMLARDHRVQSRVSVTEMLNLISAMLHEHLNQDWRLIRQMHMSGRVATGNSHAAMLYALETEAKHILDEAWDAYLARLPESGKRTQQEPEPAATAVSRRLRGLRPAPAAAAATLAEEDDSEDPATDAVAAALAALAAAAAVPANRQRLNGILAAAAGAGPAPPPAVAAPTGAAVQRASTRAARPAGQASDRVCFRCQQPGHLARECPQAARANAAADGATSSDDEQPGVASYAAAPAYDYDEGPFEDEGVAGCTVALEEVPSDVTATAAADPDSGPQQEAAANARATYNGQRLPVG
ncbi:hypothetical protein MNEG_13281, partial [Monoraphidium neglectum]